MAKNGSGNGGKVAMTPVAAARIQSAQAKTHGGVVAKGSFASRAQSAAAANATPKK
jgi:hypothetical protein